MPQYKNEKSNIHKNDDKMDEIERQNNVVNIQHIRNKYIFRKSLKITLQHIMLQFLGF